MRQVTAEYFFHVVIKSSPCHPSLCNPTNTQWWAASTEAHKSLLQCWDSKSEVCGKKCYGKCIPQTSRRSSVRRERQANITSAPESQNMLLKSHPASAAWEGVDNSAKGISSWLRSAFNSSYFVKPKRK